MTARFPPLVLGFLLVLPCAATEQPSWPTVDWPVSEPAAQMLDPEKLNSLADAIREGKQFPDLHALLVVRNGYLVLEEYFGGHGRDDLHTLQSVSKSFTSALVGIAIQQGRIRGVDEKVLSFFPDMKEIKNLDERKRAMTLFDLLTMRSGTDYNENHPGSPHHQLNRLKKGWSRFVLERPMEAWPGTRFQYDSGGVILMSGILENRTGMHADRFADKYLFPKMGITRSFWFRNSEKHPHTGGGLHLLPRDMAKFGLLYLRDGRWEDRQVVPASWVKESLKRHVRFEEGSHGRAVGYGYLWWVLPPDPDGKGKQDIYAAMGFRAQYIFIVPEHDMVVVVTGGTNRWQDQRKPVDFLYTHILKAVKR